MDSGIENMEVDENDRREKRSLTDKVSLVYVSCSLSDYVCKLLEHQASGFHGTTCSDYAMWS